LPCPAGRRMGGASLGLVGDATNGLQHTCRAGFGGSDGCIRGRATAHNEWQKLHLKCRICAAGETRGLLFHSGKPGPVIAKESPSRPCGGRRRGGCPGRSAHCALGKPGPRGKRVCYMAGSPAAPASRERERAGGAMWIEVETRNAGRARAMRWPSRFATGPCRDADRR